MHGWALFLSVFGVIFVAELPDKTALAALVLATRYSPFPVALGAAAALAIQSAVAVAAGEVVSLLPARPVHMFAGALFLGSAVVMWRKNEESAEEIEAREAHGFWRSTWLVFAIVFMAEWGDLTQLGTAAFAARYRSPYIIFTASTLALWAVAAIAVLIGNRAGKLLDPHLTKRIAAVIFAILGVAFLVGLL